MKRIDIGPPSETPISTACSEPAASITARTSSILVSSVGTSATRSETPVPRLSNQISRENDASSLNQSANAGCLQAYSTFEMTPGTKTRSGGPFPSVW